MKRLNLLVVLAIVIAAAYIFVVTPAIADDVGIRGVKTRNGTVETNRNIELFYYHDIDSKLISGIDIYTGGMEYENGDDAQKAGYGVSIFGVNIFTLDVSLTTGMEYQHAETNNVFCSVGIKVIKAFKGEGSLFLEAGKMSDGVIDFDVAKIGFSANF